MCDEFLVVFDILIKTHKHTYTLSITLNISWNLRVCARARSYECEFMMSFFFLLRTFTYMALFYFIFFFFGFALFNSLFFLAVLSYCCCFRLLHSRSSRQTHTCTHTKKKHTIKLEMQTVCSFEHSPIGYSSPFCSQC